MKIRRYSLTFLSHTGFYYGSSNVILTKSSGIEVQSRVADKKIQFQLTLVTGYLRNVNFAWLKVNLVVFYLMLAFNALGQKPILDTSSYANWVSVDGLLLQSNDGHYIIYEIQNEPIGSKTTVLRSTTGEWQKTFNGGLDNVQFSMDSKTLLFKKGKDSVALLTLGTEVVRYLPGISSFSLHQSGDSQCMAYFLSSQKTELYLMNLKTGKRHSFKGVNKFRFSDSGRMLILWKTSSLNPKAETLYSVDAKSKRESVIWEGLGAEDFIFDPKYDQFAFRTGQVIHWFKAGDIKVVPLKDQNPGTRNDLSISNLQYFSRDGNQIFITLIGPEKQKPDLNAVEIWTYRDVSLQTEQEQDLGSKRFTAIIDIKSQKVMQLQLEPNESFYFPNFPGASDSVFLSRNAEREPDKWSVGNRLNNTLVSTRSGRRVPLEFLDKNQTVTISSSGRFLLYYDQSTSSILSYEISTGIIRTLKTGIDSSWVDNEMDDLSKNVRGISEPLWLKNDEAVLLYDRYDIWKFDPLAIKPPLNLTNGYGKIHEVVFDYAFRDDLTGQLTMADVLYLNAFNKKTKENGFYSKRIDRIGDPQLLTMGNYIFNSNTSYIVYNTDFPALKARSAKSYIVRRMAVNDAPNYYHTNDFRTFKRLSNVQPQMKYNWYRTELHSWKSLDGRQLQGVLYKPENFDSQKKYPLIIHYYERKSDGLNAFIKPEPLCGYCQINIPTYVSQGYLVFIPDIYYHIGDPMQGTYDAVVSAAKYLSSFQFVNSKKIGIQGCSYGGVQTNYLVTHTQLFAAACSTLGWANPVSAYGSLMLQEGTTQIAFFEKGQVRMGGSLWEKPDAYLKQSSILNVDKVTTPLLMLNNKLDGVIPYYDARAFFLGLRRMGKKAWMLSYPHENHWVKDDNAMDFSIRMMQFFDHYLKDKPAPVWMTRGIAAEQRGHITGYEIDQEISTPGPGLLTSQEQKKVDSLMINNSKNK